jgi:hypothetical protein
MYLACTLRVPCVYLCWSFRVPAIYVRHEALLVRMEVEDLDLPAVAAAG